MERSELDQTELYVKRTVEFMHHNMDRNIQMKDIAAAVNLHPGYLHRIFRNYMQWTPTDYLTMLRMEKAKMLLQQTNIPISEISDYVGVGSRQYFHMLFKSTRARHLFNIGVPWSENSGATRGNGIEAIA